MVYESQGGVANVAMVDDVGQRWWDSCIALKACLSCPGLNVLLGSHFLQIRFERLWTRTTVVRSGDTFKPFQAGSCQVVVNKVFLACGWFLTRDALHRSHPSRQHTQKCLRCEKILLPPHRLQHPLHWHPRYRRPHPSSAKSTSPVLALALCWLVGCHLCWWCSVCRVATPYRCHHPCLSGARINRDVQMARGGVISPSKLSTVSGKMIFLEQMGLSVSLKRTHAFPLVDEKLGEDREERGHDSVQKVHWSDEGRV